MQNNFKYWYLHNHRLFRNLSYSEIDSLCVIKRFKKSKKNEIINLPQNEKERVYFVKKGTIKLLKEDEEGSEYLIDVLFEGDIFGDINLEKNQDHSEYFRVVSEEAVLCTFLKENLEEIMQRKPDFALNYIKFLGFNFKKIQNNYKNILFKDAKSRLILFFASLIEKEHWEENSYEIPKYLTQKDVANLICCTRQTIIHLYKMLEKEHILTCEKNTTIISDVNFLKNLAKNVK